MGDLAGEAGQRRRGTEDLQLFAAVTQDLMDHHLSAEAGQSRRRGVPAGQKELETIERDDLQPVIARHAGVGENRPLGLVRRLLGHQEQQRLIAAGQQGLDDACIAMGRLARPATPENELNRHTLHP